MKRFPSILIAAAFAGLGLTGTTQAQGPDLQIYTFSASSTWTAGQNGQVQVKVINKGNMLSAPSRVGIYLSTNSTISKHDTLIRKFDVPALSPNVFHTLQETVRAPYNTPDGQMWIGAIADIDGQVKETKELNNSKGLARNGVAKPDVIISALTVPAVIEAGKFATFQVTTKNRGKAVANSSYSGIFLSANPWVTLSDTYLGRRLWGVLAPGASSTKSITVRIPWSREGQIYVGARSDIADSVDEAYELSFSKTKAVQRTIKAYSGSGRYLNYKQARFSSTNGASSMTQANFNSTGGSVDIGITAPVRPFHYYVLIWSGSFGSFQYDALSDFSLGMLTSPVFQGWIGTVDAQGRGSASFNLPPNVSVPLTTATYSLWFSPQFDAFVGAGTNRLTTTLK